MQAFENDVPGALSKDSGFARRYFVIWTIFGGKIVQGEQTEVEIRTTIVEKRTS